MIILYTMFAATVNSKGGRINGFHYINIKIFEQPLKYDYHT